MSERREIYTSFHDIPVRDYMYFPKGSIDVGKPGKDLLEMNRIPCYDDPSLAALCISRIADYAEFRSR